MNTRVGHIAKQQARLNGFVEPPSPSPKASKDHKASNDDDDEDGDASSFSADKMST